VGQRCTARSDRRHFRHTTIAIQVAPLGGEASIPLHRWIDAPKNRLACPVLA